MNTSKISELLYNSTNEALLNYVNSTQDENELFVIAFNYNWEDGLAIPKAILSNPVCSLSTALTIFIWLKGNKSFTKKNLIKKVIGGSLLPHLRKTSYVTSIPQVTLLFKYP